MACIISTHLPNEGHPAAIRITLGAFSLENHPLHSRLRSFYIGNVVLLSYLSGTGEKQR
jgi:hypothetical protein